MSQEERDAAGVIGLAMILNKCVDAGNDLPHPSAMVGMYFGLLAERAAPDFAAVLRAAFERTYAETSGEPEEAIEATFRGTINQMADAFRKIKP